MDNQINKEKTFEYTYSSKYKDEVEEIRKKYAPIQEDKLDQLRKLDKSAERPGTIAAIMMGTIGVLIFGTGMSFTLVWPDTLLVQGIVVGIIGLIMMACALPMYRIITKHQRAKIAAEVLALSEELLK
ncbi:MAG: hypothetical protein IKM20_00070 [Erysipelotrichales bacterium]|nr:hypothetical protein [Erysipelotrichales bacterium]